MSASSKMEHADSTNKRLVVVSLCPEESALIDRLAQQQGLDARHLVDQMIRAGVAHVPASVDRPASKRKRGFTLSQPALRRIRVNAARQKFHEITSFATKCLKNAMSKNVDFNKPEKPIFSEEIKKAKLILSLDANQNKIIDEYSKKYSMKPSAFVEQCILSEVENIDLKVDRKKRGFAISKDGMDLLTVASSQNKVKKTSLAFICITKALRPLCVSEINKVMPSTTLDEICAMLNT